MIKDWKAYAIGLYITIIKFLKQIHDLQLKRREKSKMVYFFFIQKQLRSSR